MVSANVHDYGLELTSNSKVGWAFSLSRSESCINATDICRKLCYGNGVRYQTHGQRHKRLRNFSTCEFLLRKGGPELLARNLVALVDQARPVDWLAAQISGTPTKLPYSLRIHDVGDYPEFRTIPCSKISEHKIEIAFSGANRTLIPDKSERLFRHKSNNDSGQSNTHSGANRMTDKRAS